MSVCPGRLAGMTAVLLTAFCAVATAQGQIDPAAGARFQVGPLAVTPTVSLLSGVDTNVFNEGEDPKRDVIMRFNPQAQAWLKLGKTVISSRSSITGAYFRQYEDQRSFDVGTEARLDVDLFRVVPYVSGSIIRGRQRAGFEIDSRPLRVESSAAAGVVARAGSKVSLTVGAFRTASSYEDTAVFEGTSLALALNRARTGATAAVRYAVTPLTTVVLSADSDQERYEFSPLRDTNSLRVLPGVEFSPFALITGRALVGFRRFNASDDRLADFTASAASVDIGYVLRGVTRFSVRADRDVTPSYEPRQPYYLLTAWQANVAQQVSDRVNLLGSYGRQRLNYERFVTAGSVPGRADTGTTAGGGIQYVLSPGTTVGANLDYAARSSGVATRDYDGIRFGALLTYAF